MLTRHSTGTGMASIANRNRKPSLIFPLTSEMTPTMAGPINDADLSVSEKSEKNVDSWPGGMSSAYTALEYELNGPYSYVSAI